jgi:hypothetical protein
MRALLRLKYLSEQTLPVGTVFIGAVPYYFRFPNDVAFGDEAQIARIEGL